MSAWFIARPRVVFRICIALVVLYAAIALFYLIIDRYLTGCGWALGAGVHCTSAVILHDQVLRKERR